jgi:uncharacterized protein (TIGR02118 family)
MVKLTVLYGHPKDPAAFEGYYLGTHTPIAQKVKGVRRFEIAKVVGTADGSPPPYYRIADLYFDSAEHMQQCLGSKEGQAAAADIANFASGGATLLICDVQDVTSR